MAIVKVKSINDIKLPDIPKIKGGNGESYQYTSSLYFKKIPFNQGDLTLKENQERLEILTKVMNLQGTKYLILPQNMMLYSLQDLFSVFLLKKGIILYLIYQKSQIRLC